MSIFMSSIKTWEVQWQVADLWVCSKAYGQSLVSLASFGFTGRSISKEYGKEIRPWSIPHHNLVFHLALCLLVWWWCQGGECERLKCSFFHCCLYPTCWMSRAELQASKTEIALLNLLPLLPHTTSPPQKR